MKIKINKIFNKGLEDILKNPIKPSEKEMKNLIFLPHEDKVVHVVSDTIKKELDLTSNVIKVENFSSYPLGMGHEVVADTKTLYVGKNSKEKNLEDAINHASALISLYKGKYLNIKLVDKKFTNKTYYVISNDFHNSKFLKVHSVKQGDPEKGMKFVTEKEIKLLGEIK